MSHQALTRTCERLDTEQLKARLLDLWERTGDEALRRLAEGSHPWEDQPLREGQERSDWISTCVMNCFKNSGDTQVFSLLYELNEDAFLHAVQSKSRRTGGHVDAHDVVQDVFLNIFRYQPALGVRREVQPQIGMHPACLAGHG